MSEYSKPKVTIDLDEYNDLNKKVAELSQDGDNYVVMAKRVVQVFLENGGNISAVSNILEKEGIRFYASTTPNHRTLTGRSAEVHIEKINK